MTKARKLWLSTHRWLGLTVGLLFVLLGLTGSLLVFEHAIDEWTNPELLLTEGTGSRRPLKEIVAAAEKAYPEQPAHAVSVQKPRVANGVWTVWFQGGPKESPKFTQVLVDPYTAEVTGQRVWGEYLMTWVYRLHFRLLAGKTGATIVGIGGLILMVSLCTGIYLWWPLWKNGLRAAFAVRRGRRFNYDLHKTTGIISALILLAIAFTGVYMTFPKWVKPMVTMLSDETPTPKPEELKSSPAPDANASGSPGQQPLTPEQAIAIAQERFPEGEFDHFHPPQPSNGVYEVAFRQPGEVQASFGRSQVWLDACTGRILAVRDPREFTAADDFIAWQFPLHNGEAFGLVGRWVVFFTGLVPTVLYVTGFVLWQRRKGMRQGRSAESTASTTVRLRNTTCETGFPHAGVAEKRPEVSQF